MVGGNGSLVTKSAEYALRQCHWNKAEQYKKHHYRVKKGISTGTLIQITLKVTEERRVFGNKLETEGLI